MPPSGAAGDRSADRSKHDDRKDVRQVGENRKEEGREEDRQACRHEGGKSAQSGRQESCRQTGRREADPPLRRQPADRERLRRRSRAGVHRGHAGWKRDIGRRLDALIARTVPGVRKAVKWNSPLYGVGDQGWFLGVHCFTKYIKVAFFRGTSLRPVPPGESKTKDTRYLDIHEDDPLDETQLAAWVKQASKLPGERM